MRKAPLESARRQNAVDGMDKPPACPPRPQQNKTRRSGHLMRYQNRTISFAIDSQNIIRRALLPKGRAWGSRKAQATMSPA
jgi:hypothetical protein